jgi:hypothetical protein
MKINFHICVNDENMPSSLTRRESSDATTLAAKLPSRHGGRRAARGKIALTIASDVFREIV